MTAIIDKKAFERIKSFVDHAHSTPSLKVVTGGTYDASKGFFVQPTIVECSDVSDKIFTEVK